MKIINECSSENKLKWFSKTIAECGITAEEFTNNFNINTYDNKSTNKGEINKHENNTPKRRSN